MSRQDTAKKKSAKYDPICGSRFVNMLVNRMMTRGKKSLAYQIFYRAAIDIKRNTGKNPISVFRKALFKVTPRLIVKTRKRKKGKIFRVPLAISFSKGALFGIRWLLGASRQRSGKNMASQLSAELRDAAFKKRSNAIRKKEQSHKMAEANRTFAHFRSSQSENIPFSAKFKYAAFKKRANAIQKKKETRRKRPRTRPMGFRYWSTPMTRSRYNSLHPISRRAYDSLRLLLIAFKFRVKKFTKLEKIYKQNFINAMKAQRERWQKQKELRLRLEAERDLRLEAERDLRLQRQRNFRFFKSRSKKNQFRSKKNQ